MELKDHILMTRIDNRLVHGQVGVTWTMTLGANVLVVIDETAAHDVLQQKLMRTVARSSGADIRFFTVDEFVKVFPNVSENQWLYLIVHDPLPIVELLKAGIPIQSVNVGNMHFSKGKMALNRKVYVDEADLEALRIIESFNVSIFIQDVPGSVSEKLSGLNEVKFNLR